MATKSFKGQIENPAMTFISKPTDTGMPTKDEPAPVKESGYGYRGEARSKRIQVLLKPSTYARLKARAVADGVSVNEVINNILTTALE